MNTILLDLNKIFIRKMEEVTDQNQKIKSCRNISNLF